MFLIKPSFYQFVADKDKNLALEMAINPTRFRNDKGEYGDPQHVSVNAPIYFDWEDIYYLYQFPVYFWTQALKLRYNDYLFEAKKSGGKRDIRDVTLTGARGSQVTIKGINTFASSLLDKIERAVDVNYFAQAGKSKEEVQAYRDMAKKHGAEGKDLGGYYGMSLADPDVRKVGDDNVMYSRGFMFPGQNTIGKAIQNWLQGTSYGFLNSEEHGDHDSHEVDYVTPGRKSEDAETKRVKAARGGTLQQIVTKMQEVGAKPFKILSNSRVAWEVVKHKKGGSSLTTYPEGGAFLPMLLPAKSVRSGDVHAHRRNAIKAKTVEDMDRGDYDSIRGDLDSIIRQKDEDIQRRSAQTSRYKESKEGRMALKELNKLKALKSFKEWFLKNKAGVQLTPENIENTSNEYVDMLEKERHDIVKNAQKYDAHGWNVHMFNRKREAHDPFKVGMENPLEIGGLTHPPIKGKNIGFGSFYPNKQSKYMLHGPEGQWEDEFRDYFGSGMDNTTGKIKLKVPFNQDDYTTLVKDAYDYKKMIAKKLATHKQFADYLNVDRSKLNDKEARKEIIKNLSSPHYLMSIMKEKCPGVKFLKGKVILPEDAPDCMPAGLPTAFRELVSVSDGMSDLKDQVTQGTTDKSAIMDGVNAYLGSTLVTYKPAGVKEALKEMRLLIAKNAENYIRRTIGESSWQLYLNLKKSGATAGARYRQAKDLKEYIKRAAWRYCRELDQLNFGEDLDTRRLRSKNTAKSYDAPMGDDGSSAAQTISASDAARTQAGQTRALPKGSELFPDDAERNMFRGRRGKSDLATGHIAHSLDAFNKLIRTEIAKVESQVDSKANALRAKAEERNGYVLTDSDVDLAKKVSGAAVVFNMFKQHFMQNNAKATDKDANKFAKEKMIEFLKNEKLIGPQEVGQLASNNEDELKRRIRDRIESVPSSHDPIAKSKLDPTELVAKQISELWDDAEKTKPEIIGEINKIYGRSDEMSHRIADILSIIYNLPPKMDTYKLAAYEPQTTVPDVQIPQEKIDQLARQLAGVAVPAANATAANPYLAKKPDLVQAPLAPKPSPLAAFRKPTPTVAPSMTPPAAPTQPVAPPKATGMDLLRQLKNKVKNDEDHF